MHSSTSIDIRFRKSIAVGFIRFSPSEIVGNSSGMPPAAITPRRAAAASPRRCRLQVTSSDQQLAMPTTGRPASSERSSSPAWSEVRWMNPARSRPPNQRSLRSPPIAAKHPRNQRRLSRRGARDECLSGRVGASELPPSSTSNPASPSGSSRRPTGRRRAARARARRLDQCGRRPDRARGAPGDDGVRLPRHPGPRLLRGRGERRAGSRLVLAGRRGARLVHVPDPAHGLLGRVPGHRRVPLRRAQAREHRLRPGRGAAARRDDGARHGRGREAPARRAACSSSAPAEASAASRSSSPRCAAPP